jgi:hypothetical protein
MTRSIDALSDGLFHRHNLFVLRQAVAVYRQSAQADKQRSKQ